MAHPWPLFDLRLRTPRLELRLPTDDDLLGLMEVARAGVHDPAATPFKFPWDELPSPAFERNFLLHWWASRGSWKPERSDPHPRGRGGWATDRHPGSPGSGLRPSPNSLYGKLAWSGVPAAGLRHRDARRRAVARL